MTNSPQPGRPVSHDRRPLLWPIKLMLAMILTPLSRLSRREVGQRSPSIDKSCRRNGAARFTAAVMAVVLGTSVTVTEVAMATPASADINTLVDFNGDGAGGEGPMTGDPQIYLVFWGTQWGTESTNQNGDITFSNDPVGAAPGLQEMFKGLGVDGEQWSGVLTQYCDDPSDRGVVIGATWCPDGNIRHVGYPTGGALAGVWYDPSGPISSSTGKGAIAKEAVAVNGGFETGAPASSLVSGSLFGWDATGAASAAFASHSGSFAAELGSSTQTDGDSTLSQTFTVPSVNGNNRLSFWYDNVCSGTVQYDWATATLRDNTTSTTTTPLPKTCVKGAGWARSR